MLTFIVSRNNKEVFRFALTGKLVSIGRSSQCDIVLPDKSVSSLHANLVRKSDGWLIMDLQSRNGTYVNDDKISQKMIVDGNIVQVGSFCLLLKEENAGEETSMTLISRDFLEESQILLKQIRQGPIGSMMLSAGKSNAALDPLEALDNNLEIARHRQRQFQILLALSDAAGSEVGFLPVADSIMRTLCRESGFSQGVLVLKEGAMARQTAVCIGLSETEWMGKEACHCLVSTILQEGRAILSFPPHLNLPSQINLDAATVSGSPMAGIPLNTRNNEVFGTVILDGFAADKKDLNRLFDTEFMRLLSQQISGSLELRRYMEMEKEKAALHGAAEERVKYEGKVKRLELEKQKLIAATRKDAGPLWGASPVMRKLVAQAERVAKANIPILITGTTGTGKSVLARWLHEQSSRRDADLITIDCASIPSELLEAELFGYEKGAFTGASDRKKGRIEMANQGTLFLDEIGDLSQALQAKLLLFLQEGHFTRLGGHDPVSVNARIIAATNKDLRTLTREKKFREDLYYRLNGVTLEMPSLHQRGADVLMLANAFLEEIREQNNLSVKGFTPDARKLVLHHVWPGNIRELRNVVQAAALLGDNEFISPDDLNITLMETSEIESRTLKDAHEEVDKKLINHHLLKNHYHFSRTAEALGTDRSTLRRLMRKYGMEGKIRKSGEEGDDDDDE